MGKWKFAWVLFVFALSIAVAGLVFVMDTRTEEVINEARRTMSLYGFALGDAVLRGHESFEKEGGAGLVVRAAGGLSRILPAEEDTVSVPRREEGRGKVSATSQFAQTFLSRVSRETVTLGFVGDIMLDRGVRRSVGKSFNGDYVELFSGGPSREDTDILFGNLEGPVSSRGERVGSIYSFRMATVTPAALRQAGFHVLSIANNHIGDWGVQAVDDTRRALAEERLSAVGVGRPEVRDALSVFRVRGMKVGYLAFSDVGPLWLSAEEDRAGVFLADAPYAAELIREAARLVDVLVVSFHFGEEYHLQASARQKRFARRAIDLGARIVVGHHPHVRQEVEEYRGGVIAYSLGNYIFDQNFREETMQGGVLLVEVMDGNIAGWREGVSYQNDDFAVGRVEWKER